MTLVAVQHGSRFKPEDTSQSMPRRAVRTALPLPDLVVLVLQGGGALGAFQAGVYEALIDLGIELDWVAGIRSEEHTSELQSLMRISYAVFCLKKKKNKEIYSLTDEYCAVRH